MSKRLLVVDDEERIREVVRACLEDLGDWSVLTADSGQTGLQVALDIPVDAVLLDISMPDMDGFEFVKQFRQYPQLANIPIILLTAKVIAVEQERFAQMPVNGTIPKPFNPLTLCGDIAALLGWEL